LSQQRRPPSSSRKATNIPEDRKKDETYARIVYVFCDGKKDKYRTRITMGGNLVNYPGNCGTPTANLLTVKLLLNSIISTTTNTMLPENANDIQSIFNSDNI
jgi:hypothetical protein